MKITPIPWSIPWPSSVAILWSTLSPDHCMQLSCKLSGRSCWLTCNEDCLNGLISPYVMEYQSCNFVNHWLPFTFWIQWNTNTKQIWWGNRSRSTGLDDHLAPDSATGILCGRTNCLEQSSWTIEWPILVWLSLLAVTFAIKVGIRCGTRLLCKILVTNLFQGWILPDIKLNFTNAVVYQSGRTLANANTLFFNAAFSVAIPLVNNFSSNTNFG